MKTMFKLAVAAAALAFAATGALADDYPSRTITMIVPFGPGGGTDVIARTVSSELSKALNTSIVVETRPGANGQIGSAVAAHAKPDGYTLLFTASSTYSLNPSLMSNPLIDQLKDLAGIAPIGRSPWFIAVPEDSPFKSIADLVAYGKANPDKLVFPYWQSSVLVTGSTFARLADFKARAVPYRGQTESLTDFMGGRLSFMVNDTVGSLGPLAAKQMRLLASTTLKRVTTFPDVPTMTELGYAVVTDSMIAAFAPSGTPQPIIDRLNTELTKIVQNSQPVKDRLAQLGFEPATMTVPEFNDFVRSEIPRWADLFQKSGLQKQ